MNTFCAVNDDALVQLIQQAKRRIVYIAPGLYSPVAKALCARFEELGTLDVTLILDPDEEVCRIGFGELEALQTVHKQSAQDGFFVREQPGLRVGALLADDQTLVWSPTPRAVEAPPETKQASTPVASTAPNGLLLGANPGEQIARAACAEGTHTDPRAAEIGTAAVTPAKVAQVTQALKDNPPIPVDLARVTRVFSTKLQFVELKAKGANLARRKLSIASALLNVDADAQLRDLLDSRLRAFGDFKDRKVDVPVYHAGKPAIDQNQQPMLEPVSEATLTRERRGIEHEFLYDVTGFGRLMERSRRAEFDQQLVAYKARVLAHSEGLRKLLAEESNAIIAATVDLVGARAAHAQSEDGAPQIDFDALAAKLQDTLERIKDEAPEVSWVFKEVTYEQTEDATFRQRLDVALPPAVKRRLGNWYEKFNAAKQQQP